MGGKNNKFQNFIMKENVCQGERQQKLPPDKNNKYTIC